MPTRPAMTVKKQAIVEAFLADSSATITDIAAEAGCDYAYTRAVLGDLNLRLPRYTVTKRRPGRLSDDVVAAIRALYAAGGVSMKSLGDTYGVSHVRIFQIVHGRGWKPLRVRSPD